MVTDLFVAKCIVILIWVKQRPWTKVVCWDKPPKKTSNDLEDSVQMMYSLARASLRYLPSTGTSCIMDVLSRPITISDAQVKLNPKSTGNQYDVKKKR